MISPRVVSFNSRLMVESVSDSSYQNSHTSLFLQRKKAYVGNRCISSKDNLIVYYSKNGNRSINYNCQFYFIRDSGRIECRHIAWAWGISDKKIHVMYRDDQSLKNSIPFNTYDSQKIMFKGDSYLMFNFANFGKNLYKLCKNIQYGQTILMTVISECHLMLFKVRSCSDKNSVKIIKLQFYDPNPTQSSIRIITDTDVSSLKYISIYDLLSTNDINTYFPKIKYGMITAYYNPKENFLKKPLYQFTQRNFLDINANTSTDLTAKLYFMSIYGSSSVNTLEVLSNICNYEDSKHSLVKRLQANDGVETPALWLAFQNNLTQVVRTYVEFILNNNNLQQYQKISLLAAENTNGQSGLAIAFYQGNIEVIEVFMKIILNSELLLLDEKSTLLCAFDKASNKPGVISAIEKNLSAVIRVFMTLILSDQNLTSKHKFNLLLAYSSDYKSALQCAINQDNFVIAKMYINMIMNNKHMFSDEQLSELMPPWTLDMVRKSQSGCQCTIL